MFNFLMQQLILPQLIVIRKVALEIGVVCALVEVVLFEIFIFACLLAVYYNTGFTIIIDEAEI